MAVSCTARIGCTGCGQARDGGKRDYPAYTSRRARTIDLYERVRGWPVGNSLVHAADRTGCVEARLLQAVGSHPITDDGVESMSHHSENDPQVAGCSDAPGLHGRLQTSQHALQKGRGRKQLSRLASSSSWTMVAVFYAVATGGCEPREQRTEDVPSTETGAPFEEPPSRDVRDGAEQVSFDLIDRDGARVASVRLMEAEEGVQVEIQGSGLSSGAHGFHFHETGECEPPSFESAGGHFNPSDRQHGLENPQGPHAGDLPNLPVEDDSIIDTSFTTALVTLHADEQNSLLDGDGTALVIHADRDDQRTDPGGASGDRIACGVVPRDNDNE